MKKEIRMMKNTRLFLTMILALVAFNVAEATDYIRYVSKTQGSYNNDGTTWAKAKVNVQDAINDIKDQVGEGDRGFVFVEAGTYKPTQSVPGSGTSTLYMSIQIPAGIQVYGGFNGREAGATAESIISQRETVNTEVGVYMKNRTIFTGSLSTRALFNWNDGKHSYNTSFYGNCYHVVWFANNGFTQDEEGVKHYNALGDSAVLDGVVIRDGYAYNRDVNFIEHNAFGGGAYMVENAVMRNCEVFHCEASRGGGGIYMDHGGKVVNCYVHDCQTLGVNSLSGFGGGIEIDQKGLVSHCALIHNVGRSGGGLSLNYNPEQDLSGDGKYKLGARASLIAQNVSTVEAGGVYLDKGGLLNGVTIVRNRTFGTGVTLNGIVTGRSGGVYVRDHARIYNSVLWGNETTANNTNNIQYAATRSSSDERLKPYLAYVALSRADYTDWSGTKKIGISKLADENSGDGNGLVKYPLFDKICNYAGINKDEIVAADIAMNDNNSYVMKYQWKPKASSGLCYSGLQLLDIRESVELDLSIGYLYNDLKGLSYSPKCALGAYTSGNENPMHAMIGGVATMFVDPNRATGSDYVHPGLSWDSPMDNLTDALRYFREHNLQGHIYVKEGTLYTASRSAEGRMRMTSVEMVSGVTVSGGYAAESKGTDVTKRNPVAYPTIISGKVGENDYSNNVVHLVTFDGVQNAVLDGFQLRLGNALTSPIASLTESEQKGAGVLVYNGASAQLKNTSISDCTASYGAAIYVASGSMDAENCIFRNNQSLLPAVFNPGGVLYVGVGAELTINHCDIVRNVGHAVCNNGTFVSTNSLYYSNMMEPIEDTNKNGDKALVAIVGSSSNISGHSNLFDTMSSGELYISAVNSIGTAVFDWDFETRSTTYPRFVNSTKNAGVSTAGDVTYYGLAVDYTPSDMNPAVNAASTEGIVHAGALSDQSWGKDMTTIANRDFGGLPDVGALENGAFAANSATQPSYGTKFYVRDYHTYDESGQRIAEDYSVMHTDGTMRNGLSWKNAINGNAMYEYTYKNVTKGINGLQYAVNTMHDNLGLPANPRQVRKNENGQDNTLSYYDLPEGKTDGEVWVGAGIYTKPEGFVMRNHVKVLGGFPKIGNPGLQERHPQLSSKITMSEENRHLNLNYLDYETILQTNYQPESELLNAIKRNEVSLSGDMFKVWDNVGANAQVVESYNTTTHIGDGSTQGSGATMYGNGWVNHLNYVDLSGYKTMVLSGYGRCRLLFNRQAYESPYFKEVVITLNGEYELDLTSLENIGNPVPDNYNIGLGQYVHLNAIKVPNGSECRIDYISLISQGTQETNELTDFSMDVDDKTFIVTAMDGERVFYFHNSNSNQDVKLGRFSELKNSTDNYYFMRFTRVTDYKEHQYEGDVYTIQMFNANGQRYVASNIPATENDGAIVNDREGFFNAQITGDKLFAIGLRSRYGQDAENLALWRIGHDGNGFYIQNVERARNNRSSYVSPESEKPQNNRVYVRLFAQGVSVLCHPSECRPTNNPDVNIYESRVIYEGTEWDGFTIRHGFKLGVVGRGSNGGRRNSGAGISMFENAKITNCVVRQNNIAGNSAIGRGAGVYCDGGSIINCYVMDNVANCLYNQSENFGGGIYMITGTLYNTVIAHNQTKPASEKCHGAGIFMESASFYNNTIVANTGSSAIGVYTSSTTEAARLMVYNTIVIAAPGQDILWRASDNTPTTFDHCYLQHTVSELQNGMNQNVGISDCIFGYSNQNEWDNFGPFAKTYTQANADYDYRIITESKGPAKDKSNHNNNCVNAGTENIGRDYLNRPAVLPANDMDWTARIQDCRVDIGAYEYNGADDISPDTVSSRVEPNTAVYYVTERGYGTTQAFDPANAACAEKLQKVLDAAGRYKYDNPNTRVIVKLAGVDGLSDTYNEQTCFKYYPCRTTDEQSDNVRVWSIMVPRGVEVWGGYSVDDVLDKTTNEEIYPSFTENERSVMYHPTFLQTQYDNTKLNEVIKGYHVVTFTDKTFDKDGNELVGKTLSSRNVKDRAVLDGLFLVGGQADGESTGESKTVNVNQFGGAAVVTDYAHVRNCIIKDNEATYGGALALMNNGLVSGCLIIDNKANYGGGIYVIDDNVSLSSGETNHTYTEDDDALDKNMPHIYTTTVVKNTGTLQGGGLWFNNDSLPNVRVNSSVLWQNESPDQANVAGQTSPDMPSDMVVSTFEWYPFAYSAVQNLRVSGTSNINVDIKNNRGNRFAYDILDPSKHGTEKITYDGKKIAKDSTELDFYGLTVFSALCRTGMPYSSYALLVDSLGLAQYDYNKWSRDTVPAGAGNRAYVDIGARAYPSSPVVDLEHPFLRLYVAQTQDVDMEAFEKIQAYAEKADKEDENYIYSLLGSSFAYPFQNLDDALAYIAELRKTDMWSGCANNLPFEICMARGDYFPQRDMQGNYGYSLANTYLIPEGVTLMGGFDCNDIYGQYWKYISKDSTRYTNVLSQNVVRFSQDETNLIGASTEQKKQEVRQLLLDVMAEERIHEDLNMNNILEPWEFQNQTNLSGNTVNLQNSGVYHVVSVIPYAPGVGQLPKASYVNMNYDTDIEGTTSKYIGQPVIIDGIHISDGYARDYVNGSLTDNGIYDYYRGAGIRANGNWYCPDLSGYQDELMHRDLPNSVAYRDIPLYVRNSQLINNQAGYGAAMDVNTSTHIYNCLFAQNKSMSKAETIKWFGNPVGTSISYPGNGAAICYSNELEVYNTIFSNNEAEDATALNRGIVTYQAYPTLQNPTSTKRIYAGVGAALYGGQYSRLKMMNCDVVNNRASLYPAIYTLNPNRGLTYRSNDVKESDYNLITNTVFWGNAVPAGVTSDNAFAQQLCINYGKNSVVDVYQDQLKDAPKTQADLDANYSDAIWFSGYELGRGKTTANADDYRMIHYSADEYFSKSIYDYWKQNFAEVGIDYVEQNANITLSSNNEDLEGPNFCNPSVVAGYHGYNEAADWSRARLNNLTDNGSCYLYQEVINAGKDGYKTEWKLDGQGKYEGDGVYYQSHYMNAENMRSMDLGSDSYMTSVFANLNLPRVAADPSPTHDKVYIDLGVYEYPHSKLVPSTMGDAVDILWVSTIEHPENGLPDGKTWETPTSDLQRALETLMASRNSHRKELRIMDGEYAPIYSYHGYKAFYLNTKDLNNEAYFPAEAYDGSKLKGNQEDIDKLFVRSLTIKGGYSKDLRDQYDTELYPVVIRQADRLDGTSKDWNHLLLIDDATQRYGKGETASQGYGSKESSTDAVTSIPIQIDGIHFVNNQALPGTHGTAIRYNDQVNSYDNAGTPCTDYVDAPATANISISEAQYNEWMKDPSIKNDLIRTYWTDDTYTDPSSDPTNYVIYSRRVTHPVKLTITKCCIMNSGTHYDASTRDDNSSSAVYIGQYGGDALIYNSVFHSNWGNPLEAYNTRTINNTIALNRGRWILKNQGSHEDFYETGSETGQGEQLSPSARMADEVVTRGTYVPRPSKIMNSVLWRNNPVSNAGGAVYGSQFALDGYVSDSDVSSNDIFRRNAYTLFVNGEEQVTEGTDYNDEFFTNNYWNTHLSLTNENISQGPNFKNPILGATDASIGGDIEQRDFSLQPSVRLVEKGDSIIYANEVFDLAWIPTTELDYLDQNRIISTNIEVGAIEYPHPLLRVIYVDPTRTENGTGTSWASTMNASNLQNAIDMAAIYSATNNPIIDPETKKVLDRNEAYVFVKGDNGTYFPEVILRSGVNIFGSIDPNVNNDSVAYSIDEETGQYIYPTLQEDVTRIVSRRPGLVGANTERTIVPSVTTGENNTFDTERPTRIDGIIISATSTTNPSGVVLEPVLDINANSSKPGVIPAVAITNVVVADNNAESTGVNVANINNALIYEVLFRDNKVDNTNFVLDLGHNAYGVNLTVEGRTSDAAGKCLYPTSDDQYAPQASHIWYSIYNYGGVSKDENTLSGYNYPLELKNLNYQLTEHSTNIDRCPMENPMKLSPDTKNLVEFINYETDVDLLANPRVLDVRAPQAERKLDRGAFETWCIGDDQHGQTVRTNTNPKDYYGNYYPHDGSVVYLLENSNLISEAHSLVPGYLLVKKGASLYAHGQTVKAAYVAVERDVHETGSVVAVPYAMDYNHWQNTHYGPATRSYDAEGVLTLTADEQSSTYNYSGERRATARYQLLNQNSPCWQRIAANADPVEACQGILFVPGLDGLYRFTGKGTSMTDYIYTEQLQRDAEDCIITTAKTVVLTPHNNEPTNGYGQLTAAEDMGWNCFGIPYLVSKYLPYKLACAAEAAPYNITASEVEYMMHLPKELWLYYDDVQCNVINTSNWTKQNAKNYAGFYSVESWKSNASAWHLADDVVPSLWVGEGMFTQTASYEPEHLLFYLPIYKGEDSHAAPAQRQTRVYVGEVIEEDVEDVETENVIYDLQGRKVDNPTQHGIYIVNGKRVWM